MSDTEKTQAMAMAKQFVRPGDLILIKTPSTFYGLMRRLFESKYDHTVVVVDEERSLHITYPRARLVPTYLFMHILREPLVIRLNLFHSKQTQDLVKKELFLFNLKHAAIGKSYDASKVFYFMRMSLKDKMASSKAASLTNSLLAKTKQKVRRVFMGKDTKQDNESNLIVLKSQET